MEIINFKSMEEAAEKALRIYLIRCYATVSRQYQPIANMNPEEGVEHLFKLRKAGRIKILLYKVGGLFTCTISSIN